MCHQRWQHNTFGPCHEKICLRDLQSGKIQTSLLSYNNWLDFEHASLAVILKIERVKIKELIRLQITTGPDPIFNLV